METLTNTEHVTPEFLPSEEIFLRHLQENRIPITESVWRRFIPSVEVVDLQQKDQESKFYGVGKLVARINRETGKLLICPEFENFAEYQQRYVLAHEFGHRASRLASLGETSHNPEHQQLYSLRNSIVEKLNILPPEQISYYVKTLTHKLDSNDPTKAQYIAEEGLAESVAQYLSGNRTFEGFLHAKLIQFPGQEFSADEIEQYQHQFASAGWEGTFDDYAEYLNDEDYREDFLNEHPRLRIQYELWHDIDQLMGNEALLEAEGFDETENLESDVDDIWWDEYDDMIQNLKTSHSRQSAVFHPQPADQSQLDTRYSFSNTFSFFRLFW